MLGETPSNSEDSGSGKIPNWNKNLVAFTGLTKPVYESGPLPLFHSGGWTGRLQGYFKSLVRNLLENSWFRTGFLLKGSV